MALPKLTATDEMKQIAASDLPRKEKIAYGYVQEVCEYYVYLRCITQDGILKVAFFFPEHLRIDGNSPAYEVYLDKEKRQFITYNSLNQKWCEAKLDRLDWKRRYWYTKAYWVSEEDETSIQAYGDAVLRLESSSLDYHGQSVELTKNELKILYYLFKNGGKICSRGDMIEYLWDNQLYVDDNALSVNINRIREKLAGIGLTDFIKTKHRQGYTI